MANSEMFRVMRDKGTNLIDDLTLGIVNNMRYADRNVLYPVGQTKTGDGVLAEWFYDSYKAANGNSELDVIHTYITQEAKFPELSEMMMGIALVEMKHLDKLTDVILGLEGNISQDNTTHSIVYGKTAEETIRLGIDAEQKAIKGYEKIIEKVSALPTNDTTTYVLALTAKLIADEQRHIDLFNEWLEDNI